MMRLNQLVSPLEQRGVPMSPGKLSRNRPEDGRSVGSCSRTGRGSLHGLLEPVKTLNDEERKLALALAGEFDRLTLVVADKPHNCLPEQSAAARIAAALSRLDPAAQRRVRRRTRKAVARAPAPPPGSGQNVSGSDARALRPRTDYEVHPQLLTQTRQLLRKRIDAQIKTIGPALQSHLKEQIELKRLVQTTVEMQLPSETASSYWFLETHLASPETFDFRWRSTIPGAGRCYWQLIGPITPTSPGSAIASGYVTGSADQVVPGSVVGYFTIA